MELNSSRVKKIIPKIINMPEEEYNNLEITISYTKNYGYNLTIIPVKIQEYSTQFMPMNFYYHKLLGVQRKSVNRMKEAIKLFNADLDIFKKVIKNKYNVDITEEELKIDC